MRPIKEVPKTLVAVGYYVTSTVFAAKRNLGNKCRFYIKQKGKWFLLTADHELRSVYQKG